MLPLFSLGLLSSSGEGDPENEIITYFVEIKKAEPRDSNKMGDGLPNWGPPQGGPPMGMGGKPKFVFARQPTFCAQVERCHHSLGCRGISRPYTHARNSKNLAFSA
ncbi:unnamed protein product [Timema podura]|uniref:Uncharacterized protein n=1 Tax=Timema podura TaxID=61482 RepID=A0ABN7NWJ6_TIMPD|nr:unnamed protein product [Timema podura]